MVLSGRGMDKVGEAFGAGMAAAEAAVASSGAEWTVLAANNFAQNFTEDLWYAPVMAGRLALPVGAVPEPFVDVGDVAEVAVAVLTSDGHAGRRYELSGPRGLTFAEAVRTVARASGRAVDYVELTPEEYRAELAAEGMPPRGRGGVRRAVRPAPRRPPRRARRRRAAGAGPRGDRLHRLGHPGRLRRRLVLAPVSAAPVPPARRRAPKAP
ncbi:uncharacterized protein YbjT (DUF2867 family) [Streptomonospora nanhaiensis]|uniref:Uncharacterized protein YbjT (DUF2867 family) n=1 Tax=Streptomonospora nanhaiensis TaxID=1323731 RepID=A0A853BLX0_9ACTN|nr:hypothetical protein [Streptomonospora nanhaiensis]NYI96223.1 uncharacterized protein YbjT (DUF2867 family) [Streptomonospora nanhaiensis]